MTRSANLLLFSFGLVMMSACRTSLQVSLVDPDAFDNNPWHGSPYLIVDESLTKFTFEDILRSGTWTQKGFYYVLEGDSIAKCPYPDPAIKECEDEIGWNVYCSPCDPPEVPPQLFWKDGQLWQITWSARYMEWNKYKIQRLDYKYDEESHEFWFGGKKTFYAKLSKVKVLSITPERLYLLCPPVDYFEVRIVEKNLGVKVINSLWVFRRIDPEDDYYHKALKSADAEIKVLE